MRLPSSQELKALGQLTHARELSAMAELARLVARQSTLEKRLETLAAPIPAAADAGYAANLTLWQDWRKQEIARLMPELALVRAEMSAVAQRCGRAIAENSVMENLVHRAQVAENDVRQKAEIMQRTQDIVNMPRSHLLTDDFGNQDI